MRLKVYAATLIGLWLSTYANAAPLAIDWTKPVEHTVSVSCPESGPPPYEFWQALFESHGLSVEPSIRANETNGSVHIEVFYTGTQTGVFKEDAINTINSAITESATSNGCTSRFNISQHRVGL